MRTIRTVLLTTTLALAPLCAAASAQDQPPPPPDRAYQGSDRDYYEHCKKSNGTTGTIAGGVGGAVVGNALGGGTIGTLAGAGGGALLGRHLDKKHDEAQNRRNGC